MGRGERRAESGEWGEREVEVGRGERGERGEGALLIFFYFIKF
jgi:hypothetical protein